MDTQLKQRLTGAIILVLAGALLVPELLTGPRSRERTPPDSAVDADGMRSHQITLDDASDTGQVAPAAVPPAARPPVTAPPAPSTPPAPSAAPAPRAAPSAASPPPRPTARAPAGTGYVVQVGSFSSRAAADRLAADLRRRGFASTVSSVQAAGKQMFRVRVGPARDRDAATALASRLKGAGYAGSVVPAG